VLSPTTVEEIVRIANRHRVPLWTHDQGRNNGYGGRTPWTPTGSSRRPKQGIWPRSMRDR
jgi:hypothetical protein